MNTAQEFCALTQALTSVQGAAALVTVVRTHGSTFRGLGARMLVNADGGVLHGLSGGCPQADLEVQAREVLHTGMPRLVHYNRESAGDLLYEQGCGGELGVLLQPAPMGPSLAAFRHASLCVTRREAGFFATCFQQGQACAPQIRHFCFARGKPVGDAPDPVVLERLMDAFAQAGEARVGVVESQGECWLLEPITTRHQLLVVGDNSAAQALAQLAINLGWQVICCGAREHTSALAEVEYVTCPPTAIGESVALDSDTSAVVMTHSLHSDMEWVHALHPHPLIYLGVLGSRRRAEQLYAATGLHHPALRAPAGLDIGSETPASIALSIAADIHAARYQRDGGALALSTRSIHP